MLSKKTSIGVWTAGAWVFMLASHMYVPLPSQVEDSDDLLLSSSLRLTHILVAVCRSIKLWSPHTHPPMRVDSEPTSRHWQIGVSIYTTSSTACGL
jgi:hypothetical protein